MSYPQTQDSYVAKVDNFDDVMAGDINSLQNSIMAMQAFLGDWSQIGWLPAGETWTYSSATTFTVAGNVVAKYPTGSKIKLTQTSTKYFFVLSASYSSPNTTITISGGSDYSLVNAAITNPYISYVETPRGFPGYFSWSPAWTGLTVTGSPLSSGRFYMRGKIVYFHVAINPNGGTTASTSGTTYINNPPVIGGLDGVVRVAQIATPNNSGLGSYWTGQNRAYTPTWAANNGYFTITWEGYLS